MGEPGTSSGFGAVALGGDGAALIVDCEEELVATVEFLGDIPSK